MRRLSCFRGCLLGGAAGDALGYTVEFLTRAQIEERYGANGLLGYDLSSSGSALISDDTQMTLFTANGLLLGKTRRCLQGDQRPYVGYLALAYLDWYGTQRRSPANRKTYCWLSQVPELHHRRAPGTTCMQVLESRRFGTLEKPANRSKGCGGVMRAAPIGLFFDPAQTPQQEIDLLGAQSAALTHGHPMGWMPAAALVHLISRITYGGASAADLPELVNETCVAMAEQFGAEQAAPLCDLLRQAVRLAEGRLDDLACIDKLGQGWTGEEALAIALFCVLRYRDSFGPCIIAAANHDGDSDSTASIAGNLLGCLLGDRQLPEFFLEPLELRPVIDEIARDLWGDCPMRAGSSFYDEAWWQKYMECRYDPL